MVCILLNRGYSKRRILRSSGFSFPVDEMVHLLKLFNTVERFVASVTHALEGERHISLSPRSMSLHSSPSDLFVCKLGFHILVCKEFCLFKSLAARYPSGFRELRRMIRELNTWWLGIRKRSSFHSGVVVPWNFDLILAVSVLLNLFQY